jgi:CHASE2 domain-containing sensor protein
MALGGTIEILVHLLGHTWHVGAVVGFETWVIDVVNRVAADHCSMLDTCVDSNARSKSPLLVRIDETTWRDPAWGGGEPDLAPRRELSALVDHAFQLGAAQVVVDIAVDERAAISTADNDPFTDGLADWVKRCSGACDQRLILVHRERRPFPQNSGVYLPEIRESQALAGFVTLNSLRINEAAPYFEVDSDQVLRQWDLFRVICERRNGPDIELDQGKASGFYRVVPSAQLLALANQKMRGQCPVVQHDIQRAVLDTPADEPCQPFPIQGPAALSEAEQIKLIDRVRQDLDDPKDTEQEETARSAAHDEEACHPESGLIRFYWCGVRAGLRKVQVDLAELPEAGEVGNRIVFRYTSDTVDTMPALALLSFTPDFVKTWRPLVQDRIVVIGQTFDEAGDRYMTPLGRMQGALVLVNAIASIQQFGLMRESGYFSMGLSILLVIVVSFISAMISPVFVTTLSTLVVLVISIPLSLILFSHAIWLDFSAPLIGIQIERVVESINEWRESKHGGHAHDKHG